MNVYFDTEFTGLIPGAELISIGMITENNEKFYAEFNDYTLPESSDDKWLEENVINNLATKKVTTYVDHLLWEEYYEYSDFHEELMNDPGIKYHYGNTNYIATALELWLKNISNGERIQLISDVCHYDMYLLCNQIFKGAFNLPEFVNPVCYDICQDIKNYIHGVGNNYVCSRNMSYAFDLSREEFLKDHKIELPKGKKHNALYDAKIIKLLYEFFYRESMGYRVFTDKHKLDFYDTWFMKEIGRE